MNHAITPPSRYKSGRKRPKTAQERLNDDNEADARRVKAVVLAQPHRRGVDDPALESSLGRFVVRYALERELIAAGQEFGRVRGVLLAAVGAPRIDQIEGSGNPVPDDALDKMAENYRDWRRAIKAAGGSYAMISIHALLDGFDVVSNILETQVALRALAREMGRL